MHTGASKQESGHSNTFHFAFAGYTSQLVAWFASSWLTNDTLGEGKDVIQKADGRHLEFIRNGWNRERTTRLAKIVK